MIRLKQVAKEYVTSKGVVQALQPIDLHVPQGNVFGVVGKSGAGKSTLIRCANLLERPTSGKVIINNQDLMLLAPNELRRARHQIGMIFQHFNLLSQQTVYDNIAFPLSLQKKSKNEIDKIVKPLLDLVDLRDKTQVYPHQLSGGQKQRVAIARALTNKPEVLLCDEITSALDPDTTRNILNLLRDINKKYGTTMLLITHEMEVVKRICHQVAMLDKGEIIRQAEVADFFSHITNDPQNEILQNYIQQELPEMIRDRLQAAPGPDKTTLIRIYFQGNVVATPIIAHLSQKHGLEVNILQANIEYIQDKLVGVMLVDICSDRELLDSGINFLRDHGLTVEVLGYVARDVLSDL